MLTQSKVHKPVKVIVVYNDGEVDVFDKENIQVAESVIRDTDMAEEMK